MVGFKVVPDGRNGHNFWASTDSQVLAGHGDRLTALAAADEEGMNHDDVP